MKTAVTLFQNTIFSSNAKFRILKWLNNKTTIWFTAASRNKRDEVKQIIKQYHITGRDLDKKDQEIQQEVANLKKLEEMLAQITVSGSNEQAILKQLKKQTSTLRIQINKKKTELAKAKQAKELIKKSKKLKKASLKKEVAISNTKALKIKTDNLTKSANLLQRGAKSRMSLKTSLKELEEPVFISDKNPLTFLKNLIDFLKKKKEFENVYHKINTIDINYTTYKNTSKTELKVKTSKQKQFLPDSITEKDRHVMVGDKYIRLYYLADIPTILSPYVLFRLINSAIPFRMSMFVEPYASGPLRKKTSQRIGSLESIQNDREKIGKRRDLDTDKELEELHRFVHELTHDIERGFLVSIYLGIEADTKKKLLKFHKAFQDLVDSIDFTFNTYSYDQKKVFESILPFNNNAVGRDRILQTTAVSYLMPFLSKQLNDPTGICLGFNAYNGSLVLIDFFKARNKNINIFGTSGSGKSVTAKLLATRLFMRDVQVLIIDPEGEYSELAKAVGGEVIKFDSDNGINPFCISGKDETDILNHISILKTFFKFFIRKDKYDSTILDEKLIKLYKKVPTFKKFLQLMKGTPMYKDLVVLEKGSLRGIFNSENTMNLDKDFIVFDISALESENQKKPAMFLLSSLIWGIVNKDKNKKIKRKRMLFIDEAHNLLADDDVAIFYKDIVKRARKRNLGVVSITQDVQDFLENDYGRGIITNAETTILLKQHHSTVTELGSIFQVTESEQDMLTTLAIGETVLFRENEHVRLNIHPLPSEFKLVQT